MGKLKLMIIAAGAVALLGAGYYFAGPMVLGKSSGLPLITTGGAEAATATPEPSATMTYTSKARVFNLADEEAFRYLKAEVVIEFELPGEKAEGLKGEAYKKRQEEFELEHVAELPRLEDALTLVLTSKTSEELITTGGKEELKEQLRREIEKIMTENEVHNIYFTEFIIQ